MNEIIQKLECEATSGKENFYYISEKRLNAIKELSKREQIEKEKLQRKNQELQDRIEKAIDYMKDFTFEPLLVNEDRKLIMFNENLREFERILKGEE